MELVIDFEKQYNNFTDKYNLDGMCLGLCLVWLGDILKNRTTHHDSSFIAKWTTGWFSSSAAIAHIPSDKNALEILFQRARKQQGNLEKMCAFNDPFNALLPMEIMTNYKNLRQIDKEMKNNTLGLRYKYKRISDLFSARSLEFSHCLQGNIISFFIPNLRGAHAVAQVSISPSEVYFLDPNKGLYRLNGQSIALGMAEIILKSYKDPEITSQVTISRKF